MNLETLLATLTFIAHLICAIFVCAALGFLFGMVREILRRK